MKFGGKRIGNIVDSAQQMQYLHKKLVENRDPLTCKRVQRQIDATDSQIDRLVYELYGLKACKPKSEPHHN